MTKVTPAKSCIGPPTWEVVVPIRFDTGVDDAHAVYTFLADAPRWQRSPLVVSGAWKKILDQDGKEWSFQKASEWSDRYAAEPKFRDHVRGFVRRHILEGQRKVTPA